jgi:hypothetical protein
MRPTSDEALRLAARQHGVVSRPQARAAGMSDPAIDRAIASGRLVPVERGVYRAAGAPLTWRGRVLALCLAIGGVASHRTGAALRGVRGFTEGILEVTVPRRVRSHRQGVLVHQSLDLHRAAVGMVDGIPTTTPARLAVDLGAVLPERRVEAAIQDMVASGALAWDEVGVAVLRHSRRGRNGVGVARRIVEQRAAGLVGDSVLESVVLTLMADAGLPAPVTQLELHDDRGFVARVDACWPDRGIVVEADGRAFHLNEEAFEADREKRNRLRVAGWLVIEVTWRMCMEHRRRLLADLRRALDAHPPGSFDPSPFLA